MIILNLALNAYTVTGFTWLKVGLLWALITHWVLRNSATVCLSGALLLGDGYTTLIPMYTWHCTYRSLSLLQPLMWVVVIMKTNGINEVEFTPSLIFPSDSEVNAMSSPWETNRVIASRRDWCRRKMSRCDTWDSHSCVAKHSSLLRCFALRICKYLLTFKTVIQNIGQ